MDSSSSISDRSWKEIKKFVIDLVYHMDLSNKTHHVGLVSFGDEPRIDVHLNEYQDTDDMVAKVKLKYIAQSIKNMYLHNEIKSSSQDFS